MENSRYMDFLKSKMAIAKDTGFEISADSLNPNLLPHQRDIVAWAIKCLDTSECPMFYPYLKEGDSDAES